MSNEERKRLALKIKEALKVSESGDTPKEVIIDMYLLSFESEIKSRILQNLDLENIYTEKINKIVNGV